jgi:hypothetical protein
LLKPPPSGVNAGLFLTRIRTCVLCRLYFLSLQDDVPGKDIWLPSAFTGKINNFFHLSRENLHDSLKKSTGAGFLRRAV